MSAGPRLELGFARWRGGATSITVLAGAEQYGATSMEYGRHLARAAVETGRAQLVWICDSGGRQVLREGYLSDFGGRIHHLDYTEGRVDGVAGGVLVKFGDPMQAAIGYLVAPDRATAEGLARSTLAAHPEHYCAVTSEVGRQNQRGLGLLDSFHLDRHGTLLHGDMQADQARNKAAQAARRAQRDLESGGPEV